MPELPEVRVVSKFLRNELIGKTITHIDVYYDKMMNETVKEKLIGQTVNKLKTLGKYIVFELTDYDLISHLRMEGKYYQPTTQARSKHDHVVFFFNDLEIRYHDTRKFGTFDLRNKDETYVVPPLSKLGKEPFDLDPLDFYKSLKNRHSPIKSLLLNQHLIAGIGNIYADEILFLAKIHPLKKGNKITKQNSKDIINSSIDVLTRAIDKGGTTLHSFKNNGEVGWFSQELNVHLQEHKPCKICGNPIQRIKVGGRSTYFCKTCQRK